MVTSVEDDMPSEDRLSVTLYPNPVARNQQVNLAINDQVADVDVKVFNVLGQEVLAKRVSAFSRSVKLDVGELASGVYLVRTTSGNQSNTRTFTVR